jgi:indolepyruvate ferredoxin oxidoreductase beta subunit
MEALAQAEGAVISAALFGALAGAGVLPFPRAGFEAAIRAGGKGVEGSLRAFAAAADRAAGGAPPPPQAAAAPPSAPEPQGPATLRAAWQGLAARAAALPPPVAAMALAGLRKVVDFQDPAYGAEYLDRLDAVLARDDPARGLVLSNEAAKHIANAMAYDDVIRVADLKTRPARLARIRAEMGAGEGRLVHLTEFLHPRAEEIVGLLPAATGARLLANPVWMARIGRWFGGGRRPRTDRILPFLLLYLVGGLRFWRRRTLRHAEEVAHLEGWLAAALAHLPDRYDLACEVVRCRRLVKGYSDTHARGLSKFDRVMAGIGLVAGRPDAADWARRLREAALQDEEGRALDGALATIRSFV